MQKVVVALAVAILFCACDPTIKKFEIVPDKLQCPGSVTITWQGDADGARLQADQPVTPALPNTVLKKGTLVETVTKTTTFQFFYPSAAHREKIVMCNGSVGPGGPCGPQTLTFTGTCFSAQTGPTYSTQSVSSTLAPGNLVNLMSDADFPVHVQHAGQNIALGAGGGPLSPLPAVPAAGDYTITIPGQVGQMVCAGAGPTSGPTDAPIVHITVTPTCP